MGGPRNLEAAELHEGDVAPGELDPRRMLWWAARNSTAWALSRSPASRRAST